MLIQGQDALGSLDRSEAMDALDFVDDRSPGGLLLGLDFGTRVEEAKACIIGAFDLTPDGESLVP